MDLSVGFGGLRAVDGVSLQVTPGARHALIGPNGAGKTTLINLLSGTMAPDAGRIMLEGADITALSVHVRVARGLARTFQVNQLFADLTPLESVEMDQADWPNPSIRAIEHIYENGVSSGCDSGRPDRRDR
jgi:branched-chain amino acid transport system ATP-binding protein